MRRPPVEPRPLFFLFLVFGTGVVLPYLILRPAAVTTAAAWKKRPRLIWRGATVASVAAAILLTCPPSPWFVGLEGPIAFEPGDNALLWWFSGLCYFVNSALIAAAVLLPLSAASTAATVIARRRN